MEHEELALMLVDNDAVYEPENAVAGNQELPVLLYDPSGRAREEGYAGGRPEGTHTVAFVNGDDDDLDDDDDFEDDDDDFDDDNDDYEDELDDDDDDEDDDYEDDDDYDEEDDWDEDDDFDE